MSEGYRKNSLSLIDAVAMGTGVMIGVGILALTGQIAELAGSWFPLAFIAGAVITAGSESGCLSSGFRWKGGIESSRPHS